MSEAQDTTTPATTAAPVAAPAPQEQQPAPQPAVQVSSVVTPSVTATAAAATAAVASPPVNGTATSPAPASSSAPAARPSEELTCMWQGCTEKLPTPESLYEHVCERHVGRKSTNNLNLTCQWGSCRTTTVKRDHITSHIRVHVPLKPHKCDFCGKAFKRPQDLKKHVKTHADDSVLVRSPEPGSRNPDIMFGGAAKGGYAAAAHYFEPSLNAVPSQGYPHGPPQYYQAHHPPQAPNPSYGNVYYALNTGPEPGHASYESKKRGYDALNEFFGDLKRRQFDPNSYAAVGQRLLSLQNLSLPVLTTAPLPEYQPMPAPVAVAGGHYGGGHHAAPAYHLPPMTNVRTKSDLINIDQFLQQMQETIYENDDHVAAAGVAQPGAHYVHGAMSYRTTHSPPTQLPSTHATAPATAAPILTNTSAHSPSASTPALTPPSSAQSYTSGRSPISLPSAHRVSPPHESGAGMYPRLPSATDGIAAGYPATSSAAPPSTLGGIFDHDERRRYTGGTLQRARPASRAASESMDLSDDKESGERTPKQISASLIDPALHGSGSPRDDEATMRTAQAATEVAERTDVQSQWVEKARLIEYLRKYIADRLERGEFDELEDGSIPHSPVSKANDRMEGVETTSPLPRPERSHTPVLKSDGGDTVMYPTLRGLDEDGDSKMPS
ncbi:Putative pH-response transcription factor pacC/RIM101 [Aspergillus calidoustus]|uniref:pH-response transcription factor pacC/RIM101 n=1 Tax=Aspergillus calidoustus TaxID=454130 RepID=A0A0U5G640_ASPCI|nr:Putative pH-response transcription factor pacC/RIM101 [Aspergillus calidoustus]